MGVFLSLAGRNSLQIQMLCGTHRKIILGTLYPKCHFYIVYTKLLVELPSDMIPLAFLYALLPYTMKPAASVSCNG